MSVFDETTIEWGQPGIPGTGLTEAEKTTIVNDIADLKARPIPPDTTTDLTDWSTAAPTNGQLAIYNSSTGKWTPTTRPAITVPFLIPVNVTNGASVLTTGTKAYAVPNFAWTITGWAIVNTPSGNIQFDILKEGVSIVGSNPPKVTGATGAQSTTLTGWTTTGTAGQALTFVITGTPASSTIASLNLYLTREI